MPAHGDGGRRARGALTREKIAPRAAQYDRRAPIPVESWRDLWREGFLAAAVPAAHGGLGLDMPTYIGVIRTIARGCASTAMTVHMHSTVMRFIDALGTEAQKRRYFARGRRPRQALRELGQRARGEPLAHVPGGDGPPRRRRRVGDRRREALLHHGPGRVATTWSGAPSTARPTWARPSCQAAGARRHAGHRHRRQVEHPRHARDLQPVGDVHGRARPQGRRPRPARARPSRWAWSESFALGYAAVYVGIAEAALDVRRGLRQEARGASPRTSRWPRTPPCSATSASWRHLDAARLVLDDCRRALGAGRCRRSAATSPTAPSTWRRRSGSTSPPR